jgi:hypothetical protein
MPAVPGLGVVRAWAAFDLVTGLVLLTPPGAHLFLALVGAATIPLPGSPRLDPAPLGQIGMLFCNLAGALVVLWALVRLLRPSRFLGLADVAARIAVALLIAAHVALAGLPWPILAFVLTEVGGALHQGWVLGRG